MAIVDRDKKEITCKLLYFSADTTNAGENLASLLHQTSPLKNSSFVANPRAPFHFLPLSCGSLHGYELKAHLYTYATPQLLSYPLLARFLFTGLDGFMLLCDKAAPQDDRVNPQNLPWVLHLNDGKITAMESLQSLISHVISRISPRR